jgi:hypothetical protein
MKRASVAAVISMAVLACSLVGCADLKRGTGAAGEASLGSSAAGATCRPSPIPLGVYRKTITSRQTHAWARAHDVDYDANILDFIVGRWTLHVGAPDPNCYYAAWHPLRVNGKVVFVDDHPFTVVNEDRIVFHGANEPDGLYQVIVRPRSVQLIRISDWNTRAAAHEIGRWILVEAQP